MATPRTGVEGKMLKAAVEDGALPEKTRETVDPDVCVQFCAALAGFEGGPDSISWFYTHFPRFGRLQTRQFAVFAAVIAESPEKTFHKLALELSGLRWGQAYGMMKADPGLSSLYDAALDSRQRLAAALLTERVLATTENDCARVTTERGAKGELIKTITTTDPRTLMDVLSRFDRARFGDTRGSTDGKGGGGGASGPQFHIDRTPREKIIESRKKPTDAKLVKPAKG